MNELPTAPTRRDWLAMVGARAGGAAMLRAMLALGLTPHSSYAGLPELRGAPPGTKVLVLGAGLAGMLAAWELRKAGCQVEVLEYNARAGGRCWTIRGGDRYVELGGAVQDCRFDAGQYFNPGPWRIPYHHHGVLDLARRLGVAMEPFVQVNHNAWLHTRHAFGGRPQRLRQVQADFHGGIAELLARAAKAGTLEQPLSREDQERLIEALRDWGALDEGLRYRRGPDTSNRRGFEVDPGGGLMPAPEPSQPVALADLLKSELWQHLIHGQEYDYQTTLMQPVGGMDRIAAALHAQVADAVRFNARVTAIAQDGRGVVASYVDTVSGETRRAEAAWCVCTIPLSVLGQLELQVSQPMREAISAVSYEASVKVGLQFRRRFWEEDDAIYGGISFTDLPIGLIGYPVAGLAQKGKGVLLGAYVWGPNAYAFTSMPPAQRVQKALEFGAQLHPQMAAEFDSGVAVGWHRVPWTLGCFAQWGRDLRERHYRNLCQVDGRIVLAGEHASMLPAWQEGAVLSAIDAVTRLHARIVAKGAA